MKYTLDWLTGVTLAIILFVGVWTISDTITHVLRLLALTKPFIG